MDPDFFVVVVPGPSMASELNEAHDEGYMLLHCEPTYILMARKVPGAKLPWEKED